MTRSHETLIPFNYLGTDATSPDDTHLAHLGEKDSLIKRLGFSLERTLEHPKQHKAIAAAGILALGSVLVGAAKLHRTETL